MYLQYEKQREALSENICTLFSIIFIISHNKPFSHPPESKAYASLSEDKLYLLGVGIDDVQFAVYLVCD